MRSTASIGGHDGYITCGLYADGTPGEIFVRMAKEGSTVAGLMDSFATAISLALQHGVPMRLLCEKLRGTQFEPRLGEVTRRFFESRAKKLRQRIARLIFERQLFLPPPHQFAAMLFD